MTSNNVVGATETKHMRQNKQITQFEASTARTRQNLHAMKQPRPTAKYNKGLIHCKRAMCRDYRVPRTRGRKNEIAKTNSTDGAHATPCKETTKAES
jgi:hypothetical protein